MNAPTALESSEQKTRGDIYEGIAFNFCKIATVLLLLEMLRLSRWALPITAGMAAVLFLLAHVYGTRTSRCILKKPLLIAAFWVVVAIAWLWWHRASA